MKSILLTFLLLLFMLPSKGQEKELGYFVNQALANAPQLTDYQYRIASVRIDSLKLRAALGPQVNAFTNNSYAPLIREIGQDEAITNGANIYAGMAVTKEVISKRNLQNRIDANQLQKLSLENPAKITEQDIRKSVTDQYITVYGMQQQVRFLADELTLLKKEELLFRKLTAESVYKQTDLLTFLVQKEQQDLQLMQAMSQYRSACRNLNYLCGILDTTTYAVKDPELLPGKLPALPQSIFYQQFVTDSINLVISDKQIDLSYQPKLNLFGEAAYNSSLVYQPWKNFGPNFGLNLSIPIYDGRQRKMQHDQLDIAEKTRQRYRSFFTQQYGQQVNQLILELRDNQQLSQKVLRQEKLSTMLVEANRKLLETGQVGVAEYILSISGLMTAKNLSIQNMIEKYQIISRLNYWCKEK